MAQTLRFLLADDDLDDATLFKDVLAEVAPHVEFQHAADGRQALDLLLENDALPDLIFLDLNMPRLHGKEVLTMLKANEQLHHIPVIMYTTSSQSRDIEETMQKGALCFITKPSQLTELRNILRSIATNARHNLQGTLRTLSNSSASFIVC